MSTPHFHPTSNALSRWLETLTVTDTTPQHRLEAAGALLLAEEEELCVEQYAIIVRAAEQLDRTALLSNYASCVQQLKQQRDSELSSTDLYQWGKQTLLTRHAVYQVEQGLALANPGAPVWSPAQQKQLDHADQLLRDELVYLLPLRELRAQTLEDVHPHNRAGLWWLVQGLDLPIDATQQLEVASELISAFPEMTHQLERDVARQRSQEALLTGKTTPGAEHAFEAVEAGTHRAMILDSSPHLTGLQTIGKLRSLWPLLSAAAILLLGVSVGLLSYRNSQQAAAQEKAALQQQLLAAQEEANRHVAALEDKLNDAESLSEAQKQSLQAQLEAAQAAASAAASGGSAGQAASAKPPSTPTSRSHGSSCPPGDPMCGGL